MIACQGLSSTNVSLSVDIRPTKRRTVQYRQYNAGGLRTAVADRAADRSRHQSGQRPGQSADHDLGGRGTDAGIRVPHSRYLHERGNGADQSEQSGGRHPGHERGSCDAGHVLHGRTRCQRQLGTPRAGAAELGCRRNQRHHGCDVAPRLGLAAESVFLEVADQLPRHADRRRCERGSRGPCAMPPINRRWRQAINGRSRPRCPVPTTRRRWRVWANR